MRSGDMADSILLVHPTCGTTQPDDIEGVVRIQTYEALGLLAIRLKMAGLREAIPQMMAMEPYREVLGGSNGTNQTNQF